jgi:tetratricopeptide (TPR) repeat protein
VNNSAKELFREVADIPQAERERLLCKLPISDDLRAEVESLLRFDSTSGASFTRCVSGAAQDALRRVDPTFSYCGPYHLVRLLGSGGMGAVYLAERGDGEIQQQVAVKLLRADADRPAWRDRFLRERQLLANLSHPSIARLLDAGHTADSRPYLVMEYVDGVAIDEYAARLDLRARLQLFLLVCDGVSHAHRRLIIHRDLKPSNILVDASGHPKLLDFGIAKLLDTAPDETLTVERIFTPSYASPEQLLGVAKTTATDIYSLGAVLHKLLTGRSPRELRSEESADDPPAPGASDALLLRLNPKLPRDLDHIVSKALRQEPEERYSSVDAFADDIRAFLDLRPVQARSGNAWYRARRFLRRFWAPALAAAFAIAGPCAAMWMAHREQVVAERRFNDVRQFANKLFEIDRQVMGLPGGTRIRQLIVDTSLEYLRRLAADVNGDTDLELDVGTAYMRVGRVQGVAISPNLGQAENAEQNLRVAERMIRSVLRAEPANRTVFLRMAQITHDRMVLAEDRRPDSAALPLAFESEAWLDRYLAAGKPEIAEKDQIILIGINVANWYVRKDLPERAVRLLRRMVDLSRLTNSPRQIAAAQTIVSKSLRRQGDLEGALAAARDAVAVASAPPPGDNPISWQWTLSLALSTEAAVLGEDAAINLGRPQEAAGYYERGLQMEEELARRDPNDTRCRLSLSARGLGLAGILRHTDPARAVEVYDKVLERMAEVRNNPKARRDEVRALAGSTYPLRKLGQSAEARRRLDSAFAQLKELKLYPAEQVEPGSEPDIALRALAEHEAGAGNLRRGIETYQLLLDRIAASNPKPDSSLPDATDLSNIYTGIAVLHRRAGDTRSAADFETRRLDLWRRWDHKLPNNAFVRRQLANSPLQSRF